MSSTSFNEEPVGERKPELFIAQLEQLESPVMSGLGLKPSFGDSASHGLTLPEAGVGVPALLEQH